MPEDAQSWRDVNQMLQGLMQEAEGPALTGAPPPDATPHSEASVLRERPPPEWGSALFRPVGSPTDGGSRPTPDLPFASPSR